MTSNPRREKFRVFRLFVLCVLKNKKEKLTLQSSGEKWYNTFEQKPYNVADESYHEFIESENQGSDEVA